MTSLNCASEASRLVMPGKSPLSSIGREAAPEAVRSSSSTRRPASETSRATSTAEAAASSPSGETNMARAAPLAISFSAAFSTSISPRVERAGSALRRRRSPPSRSRLGLAAPPRLRPLRDDRRLPRSRTIAGSCRAAGIATCSMRSKRAPVAGRMARPENSSWRSVTIAISSSEPTKAAPTIGTIFGK